MSEREPLLHQGDSDRKRFLSCPVCKFSVTVAADEPLPEGGPTCALGHEPTRMSAVIVIEGQG